MPGAAREAKGPFVPRPLSGCLSQLAEGPFLAGSAVAQGESIPVSLHDLPPAFVQHCQLGNSALACPASRNQLMHYKNGKRERTSGIGSRNFPPAFHHQIT